MQQIKNYNIVDLYLEIAKHEDFEEHASKILESGVDVNDRSISNYSSLMYACYRGWLNQVKFLIENGARIQDKGNDGENSLLVACMDRPSFAIYPIYGIVKDEAILSEIHSVLYEEAKRYKEDDKDLERREIIKYLLEQGIDSTCLCDPYGLIRNASALDIYLSNPYMNDLSIIDLLKNSSVPLRKNRDDLYFHGGAMSLSRKLTYYDNLG